MDQSEAASGALDAFMSRAQGPTTVDMLLLPTSTPAMERHVARLSGESRVAVIEDDGELAAQCTQLERTLKYEKALGVARNALDHLANLQYVPQNVEGSFKLSIIPGFGASESKVHRAYLIRKDRVLPHTLSRFVSAFTPLSPPDRPKVVLDANGRMDEAIDLVGSSKDAARVFTPADRGIAELALKPRPATDATFVELALARSYTPCADLRPRPPKAGATDRDHRRYVMMLYQRVQALKQCDRKFDAAEDLGRLERYLKRLIASRTTSNEKWFGEALLFTLLDKAYALEASKRPVDEALTIAQSLDSDLASAAAVRFINFTSGVSAFAEESLLRSADIMRDHGFFEDYVHARTNAIVTQIHRSYSESAVGAAEEVADFVMDWTPYYARLSTTLNAIGTLCMVHGLSERALSYFARARKANGARLHQISAEINERIALRLLGESDDDALERICNEIEVANLSKRLDYHQTYLFANLHHLAKGRAIKARIEDALKDNRFLPYTDDMVERGVLLEYLATRFRIISDGKLYRGLRGEFVGRYGLLPIAQFAWS